MGNDGHLLSSPCGAPEGDLPEPRRWKVAAGVGGGARVATGGVAAPQGAPSPFQTSPVSKSRFTRHYPCEPRTVVARDPPRSPGQTDRKILKSAQQGQGYQNPVLKNA
eukprot:COSAG01_NODE_1898_length_8965_cov_8.656366_2_plen_108_part_00